MDFEFINKLVTSLNETNIFKYSFAGAKILALALLLFRLLETFVKDTIDGELKIGNTISVLGYALVIMSSDWIIDSIELVFENVDTSIQLTSSDLYTELADLVEDRYYKIFFGSGKSWYQYISIFFSAFKTIMVLLVAFLLGGLFKLADLSITAAYLVQRVFIVQLLKFLFPLAVALSTFSGTAKLLYSWILRYIGVFILGIAYIGIINLMSLVQESLVSSFSDNTGIFSEDIFSYGVLITVVVVFTIKVKLLQTVTSYVYGMFQ